MSRNSRSFPSVRDNKLETKVLIILGGIDDPIDSWFVEDCHCLSSKGNHKKTKVLLNKNNLKNIDLETVNLPSGTIIYINKSLCSCHKKLWSKCKKLWDAKNILSFWTSNGSIRVKLKNEEVSIITHDCDLENLFSVQVISDCSCVMSVSRALIQNSVNRLGRSFFLKTIKGPWLLAVFAEDSVLVVWMGFVCSSLWLFVFMKFISLTISRYFDHATPFLFSSSNFASVDESLVEL